MSIQLIESTVDSSGDASDSDSSEDEDLSPILKRPRVYAAKVECCKCWRLGIPPTWLVLCGAIMVQVGFGLYPVVLRRFAVSNSANPVVFSFYRDAAAAPVMFTCSFIVERKFFIPPPKMLLFFAILGLLGVFGSQLLYILGVYFAGAVIVSALHPLTPVWAAIFAYLMCIEKLPSPYLLHTWTKFAGIGLAVGGAIEAALTSSYLSGGERRVATHYLLGCLLIFGDTLCTAAYIMLMKKFIFNNANSKWRNYPVAITAYAYLFGFIYMGLASLYVFPTGNSKDYKIPPESAYGLVYAIFITSSVCYLLLSWTIMFLTATIVAAFWPVQILVTLVASFPINGETLQPLQYIGTMMILIGLFLVLFSNHMVERQLDGRRVIYCCPHGPSHTCVDVYHRREERTQEIPLLPAYDEDTADQIVSGCPTIHPALPTPQTVNAELQDDVECEDAGTYESSV